MKIFIWTILIIFALEAIVKLCYIAKWKVIKPTLGTMAGDIIVFVALIVWGAILLNSN